MESRYIYLTLVLSLLSPIIECEQSYLVNLGLSVLKRGHALSEVATFVDDAWAILDEYEIFPFIPEKPQTKSEKELSERFDRLTEGIEELQTQGGEYVKATMKKMENLVEQLRLEIKMDDMVERQKIIETAYSKMISYAKGKRKYEKRTIENLVDNIVSQQYNSVTYASENIFTKILDDNNPIHSNIWEILVKNLETNADLVCNVAQSPQQVILSFLQSLVLTEMQAYLSIQFAYMIKKSQGEGNFTAERETATETHQNHLRGLRQIIRPALTKTRGKSSRELWRCDPPQHVKGVTYVELTRVIEGTLQKQSVIDRKGQCYAKCDDYGYTKTGGCGSDWWCRNNRESRCQKVVDCKTSDSKMQVCMSLNHQYRALEYVQYDSGRVLGKKGNCRKRTFELEQESFQWFWHCEYCLCLCDNPGPLSDRYINLRASMADVANNRVVTGLRFVKHNRIIHLQIQEGKLLPLGQIDKSTVHWVPVENYRVTDRRIYPGQDYHTVNWEKRAFDLDDLEGGTTQLVTGVRFHVLGSHVNLQLHLTEFNYDTGKLDVMRSRYVENQATDASIPRRTEVRLQNPDVPTLTVLPSQPDSAHNQFIKFINSDLYKDMGQTTVPFFDGQKVESIIPVPLSGVGVFHKGQKNYGGFITPKIITYDFSPHAKDM